MQPAAQMLLGSAYAHTLAAYTTSFILGTLIGLERQWRQRSAGLRTNVLVAVAAAAFADLGYRMLGADGGTRIVSYVVSGIGFLGAGVILKDGAQIRGLNTAATLWSSAAVGALSGSGLFAEAATLAAFVLAGNTLLRPLVDWVNRRPITPGETEAKYSVFVNGALKDVSALRDLIDEAFERTGLPIRSIEILANSPDQIELEAVLVPTSIEDSELDTTVASLEASPLVTSATWTVETVA